MDPPVRVTAYVWESRPGQLSLTVSCQLSFRLVHGAEAQFIEPARFFDDDLAAIAHADVHAPYKPRADLLLVGHAFAPVTEAEVEWLLVRLRLGEYVKGVRVTGDRVWVRDARGFSPGPPNRFRRMMLSPERAMRSAENPRGVDPQAVRMEHRIAFPNLEPVVRGQDATLGPVPPTAPRRASMLHPHHATWIRALLAGQHSGPPPVDLPFAYFNIAPADQQIDRIQPGTAIVLEGLHPEHALFSSRLPSARVRAHVFDPARRAHVEIEMRPDTLWIDMDREIAMMVVRGVTPVAVPDAASRVTARVELFTRDPTADSLGTETHMGALQSSSDLPFVRAAVSSYPTAGEATGGDTVRLRRLELPGDKPAEPLIARARDFVTQEISLDQSSMATPFEPKSDEDATLNLSKRAPTRAIAPHVEDESSDVPTPAPFRHLELTGSGDLTSVVDAAARKQVLELVKLVPPFISATPPPPLPAKPLFTASPRASRDVVKVAFPAPPARVLPAESSSGARLGMLKLGALKLGGHITESEEEMDVIPAAAARPPPAESRPDETEHTTSLGTEDTPPATSDSQVTATEAPSDTANESSPPSEPPTRTRSVPEEATDMKVQHGLEARTLEEAEAEGERDAFEFPLPPSDGFEVDGVTLEHCAAVRAAMAMPGADRETVLKKNDLDDAEWGRIEKAHMTRIDQETSKGGMDLLQRYDAAYVAAQDRLRRPVGVDEYARILLARENGTLTKAMTDLAIPRAELMRLDRVWKQRRGAYPDVDKAIEAAVAARKKEAE